MSPLDLQGELEVYESDSGVSVTIPLAEPESEWLERYDVLARSEGLEARAEPRPGGVVLRVNVASGMSREQTFELLDAAVALIERAKADANGRREAAFAADRHVREWWSARSS